MMTAPIYGQNIADNFQFCLKNGFDQRASSSIAPFYTYLGSFAAILVTFMNSINSIRMTFATIIGSVTQVFSEFSQRLQALFYRFQMSAMRIKFLMSRLFGTMYSVLFMGMSGIRATQNFGNTFLFKFLNVFCFDPATRVDIEGKGSTPMEDVRVGDTFITGEKVTSTFRFAADGHEMVRVGGVTVSRKHHILHNGKWIEAGNHPSSLSAGIWSGELVCLNTSTHTIPIQGMTFRDYDETDEYVDETMTLVMSMLNGGFKEEGSNAYVTSGLTANTMVILADRSSAPAHMLRVGTPLLHGSILGIHRHMITEVCDISGETLAAGTAIWCSSSNTWKRASSLATPRTVAPTVSISYIVSPSAIIETANGSLLRDFMEIHDPAIHWFSRAKEAEAVSVV